MPLLKRLEIRFNSVRLSYVMFELLSIKKDMTGEGSDV